jgi:hypothetical protein
MARPSYLDDYWDNLLCMTKYMLKHGLSAREAVKRVLYERDRSVPVPGSPVWSELKLLERYERAHREELRRELGPVPRQFEKNIEIENPTQITFTKIWRIKLATLRTVATALVKNTWKQGS